MHWIVYVYIYRLTCIHAAHKREQPSSAEACIECVVRAMRKHLSHAEMQKQACSALGSIAAGSERVKEMVGAVLCFLHVILSTYMEQKSALVMSYRMEIASTQSLFEYMYGIEKCVSIEQKKIKKEVVSVQFCMHFYAFI